MGEPSDQPGAEKRGKVRSVLPVVNVARGEWGATLLSGAFFFCVLFGTSSLRPVREAMGVERGMDQLPQLFYWTAGVSLLVSVLFGGLVTTMDRRRFIPIGFRVVMLCLVLFILARAAFGDDVKRGAGAVFYVWLSVFNMFVMSVFWAYMADIWRLEQAKRLYPVIGVGGTLGAFAGAGVPLVMSSKHIPDWIREATLPHAPLLIMGLAIVVFELGVRCMFALDRLPMQGETKSRTPHAIGGTTLEGFAAIARSPYLMAISLNAAFIAISSTIVYFAGVRLVVDKSEEMAERLWFFAQFDLIKQFATLLLQLFVTSHLLRFLGVGGTLCVLPLLTAAGFGALALMDGASDTTVWVVFAIFQGLHSATRYGIMRPSRETLFSVVSASEKYKAKTVVDTFVYRAGDVAGARIESALTAAAGLTLGSMILLTGPMAGAWVVLALVLGRMQRKRARAGSTTSLDGDSDKGADS